MIAFHLMVRGTSHSSVITAITQRCFSSIDFSSTVASVELMGVAEMRKALLKGDGTQLPSKPFLIARSIVPGAEFVHQSYPERPIN